MAGHTSDDDEPITEINIIPFVDIVLVILVIFMVTASYIVSPAIRVNLPKAQTAEPTPQSMLSFVLTREGELYMNNAMATDDDVRRFIRTRRADGAEVEAIIAADASVPHGRVVALIDLIKSEGIAKFALNTDDSFSSGDVIDPDREEDSGEAGEAPS